ncbi:hypothetical protein MMC07_008888 [Pseudocyphellaria aurata]|nr:hypothetical protein [Pseudocyphellaria aurata]
MPRAGNCASSGNSCSSLGAPALCCPSQSVCTLDPLNNVACCPQNAACTGTISPVSILPTSTVTATVTPAPSPGSAVPNAYFPFTYLPTTFANAAACSSSYSGCQSEYTSCTNSLGAAGAAITVVQGGGVTVLSPIGSVSAQQICQSLSQRVCYGLQLASCGTAPITATAAATQATFIAGSGAKRRKVVDPIFGFGFFMGAIGMFG